MPDGIDIFATTEAENDEQRQVRPRRISRGVHGVPDIRVGLQVIEGVRNYDAVARERYHVPLAVARAACVDCHGEDIARPLLAHIARSFTLAPTRIPEKCTTWYLLSLVEYLSGASLDLTGKKRLLP